MPTVGRVFAKTTNIPLNIIIEHANTVRNIMKKNGALTTKGQTEYSRIKKQFSEEIPVISRLFGKLSLTKRELANQVTDFLIIREVIKTPQGRERYIKVLNSLVNEIKQK